MATMDATVEVPVAKLVNAPLPRAIILIVAVTVGLVAVLGGVSFAPVVVVDVAAAVPVAQLSAEPVGQFLV